MIRFTGGLFWPCLACVMGMVVFRHNKNVLFAGLTLLFGLAISCASYAATPVSLKGESGQAYARILIDWPLKVADEDLKLDAHIKNGVLIASFNRPYETQTKPLLEDLKDVIALVRLDPDGKTMRIALRDRREVKISRSYNVFAIDLLVPESNVKPPKLISAREAEILKMSEEERLVAERAANSKTAPPKPGPAIPLKVRAAETSDYTRIAFDWTQPVKHSIKTVGNRAELTFDRPAVPDLSALNVNPPRGLIRAGSQVVDGKTIVKIILAPGHKARLWEDDNKVLVDLFEPASDAVSALPPETRKVAKSEEEHKPVAPPKQASLAKQDPSPGTGIIRAKVSRIGTDLQVAFSFAAPVGSAAFRRAETIWVVFDDNASLDMTELQRGASQHIRGFETFLGKTSSGIRFQVPPSTQVEAQIDESGQNWVFAFGEKLNTTPGKLKLYREADGSGPGRLIAELPGVTNILTIDDPEIGDQISVATALGPITGVQSMHTFVEVTALPSAQGLAFEVNADGVIFEKEKNQIIVRNRQGLSLTPSVRPSQIANNNHAQSSLALPARNATPGFIDFAGWAVPDPELDFNANYDAKLRRVAAEQTDPQTHIDMARFLVANHLAPEALGMLQLAQRLDPMLVQDAQFRALRGTANLLMHRIKDARADFAAQTLNRDPSAALWRGYLAAQMEDWGVARREFDAGREAFYLFVPKWQARFRNAYARSALSLNDLGTAKRQLDEALAIEADQDTRLRTRLIRAAYAEASGDRTQAIRHYEKVAEAGYEPLEAEALFQKTRLMTEAGLLKPAEAADQLENLRYRWRGDNTELEEVLALGKIYGEMGDYNRALKAMNTAVMRFPDSPVTRRISADMHTIFNNLFLHGGADSMDPVQALALFYQFIDMVPIGSEGDRMLRLLSDRLVAFDLLPQATELLQHQVDHRIRSGQARAQIAAKLALIYLMDRQPEKALNAIRGTRQARLAKALNQERRLIEARALMALGKADHALELIETDRTRDATILRANIAWQSKNWSMAGPLMLKAIERYIPAGKTPDDEESGLILRTAIALSLGNERALLKSLRQNYIDVMKETKESETFDLVTRENNVGNIPVKDLAPTLAQTQDLQEVLKRYQERFEPLADTPATASGAP